MSNHLFKASLGLVIWIAVSHGALAAQPPAPPGVVQSDVPSGEQPSSVAELAQMSGGQVPPALALTEQDLTAVNSGNHITADTFTTGAITLRDNAFADFNGVGNVIMNTGANNNIQSSLSVTIVMAPPAQ